MTFEIGVGGRTREVRIEPAAGTPPRFRITLDGTTHLVDVQRLRADVLSLIFVDAGHASHEVRVTKGQASGDLTIDLAGVRIPVAVNGRRARRADTSVWPGGQGPSDVVAPMPGRVVRLLAEPGQEVRAGQGLIVVEAMKMENELRSPKSGRVKDITVGAGMSVEAGRVLVIVE